MSKVLFILAHPKETHKSTSLKLGKEFLETYKMINPTDEITILDLYKMNIPEIDRDLLEVIENLKKGINLEEISEKTKEKLEEYNYLTDQFVNADKYVFVSPMWNLSLPARVKSYIDVICVSGKTFKYTPKGAQGVLENKKCLHLHSSGGFHSNDPMNHADKFLKDIMAFMGVSDYKSIVIEGHNAIPTKAEEIIEEAHSKITEMVKWLSK